MDRAKHSVFGVFLDADHTHFRGCAWKFAPDTYITCFHVVGEARREGAHGIAIPLPPFRFTARTFYLRNGTNQARVRPLPGNFASADIAVLVGHDGNTALPLQLSDRAAGTEASVVSGCRLAVGYSAAGVELTGHGRVQSQVLGPRGERAMSGCQCDYGMSGCPVLNTRCQVAGCTGSDKHPKTRILSHERFMVMQLELQQRGRLTLDAVTSVMCAMCAMCAMFKPERKLP